MSSQDADPKLPEEQKVDEPNVTPEPNSQEAEPVAAAADRPSDNQDEGVPSSQSSSSTNQDDATPLEPAEASNEDASPTTGEAPIDEGSAAEGEGQENTADVADGQQPKEEDGDGGTAEEAAVPDGTTSPPKESSTGIDPTTESEPTEGDAPMESRDSQDDAQKETAPEDEPTSDETESSEDVITDFEAEARNEEKATEENRKKLYRGESLEDEEATDESAVSVTTKFGDVHAENVQNIVNITSAQFKQNVERYPVPSIIRNKIRRVFVASSPYASFLTNLQTNGRDRLIIICGPTSSGKHATAVQLGLKLRKDATQSITDLRFSSQNLYQTITHKEFKADSFYIIEDAFEDHVSLADLSDQYIALVNSRLEKDSSYVFLLTTLPAKNFLDKKIECLDLSLDGESADQSENLQNLFSGG